MLKMEPNPIVYTRVMSIIATKQTIERKERGGRQKAKERIAPIYIESKLASSIDDQMVIQNKGIY